MKIHHDEALQIACLRKAGLGYSKIGAQLGLSRGTVAKHCQKIVAEKGMLPKVKRYRCKIRGRKPLEIKTFVNHNPLATLKDILTGCDLDVCMQNHPIGIFEKVWNGMQGKVPCSSL